MRATVVLPEPDSPTMASEPLAGTAKLTSSTATSSSAPAPADFTR
jgi:hypothetical protein